MTALDRLGDIEARAATGNAAADDVRYLAGEVRRLRRAEELAAALMTEPAIEPAIKVESWWMSPLDVLAHFNPHVRAELARLRTAAAFTDDHVDEALALANAGRGEPRHRSLLRLVGR